MKQALTGADIVVIPAGIPRKHVLSQLPMFILISSRQARYDP